MSRKRIDSPARRAFLNVSGAAAASAVAGMANAGATRAEVKGLLAGKVAVIYGAAGAIGSAVARAFAREGARVFLAGRTLEKVVALAQELEAQGGKAHAARVDALDRAQVEKHLADVMREHARVDITFNLIGFAGPQGASLTDMGVDDFASPIDRGLRTHFITSTAAARHMCERRGGVILALTAQVARKPYAASGGFGVACAAIEGLCRQLAVDLGADGIRVVTLRSAGSPDAPGVAEAIGEHAKAAGVTRAVFEARIAEKTMLKRMPRVAEVANAAVLAASEHASAITADVFNLTCGEIAE
jgi:3-oxoacyl-[acyl-carrier protein] reductase